ncbi:MAG: FtsX-like permease family protein [Prevotellaceae bacterium]|nr:FtsX-like permease family protein [Prevotellaceae bacterium]
MLNYSVAELRINLTVAQSNRRAKEMATRRLLGSQRSEIIMRLVTESILMCAVSMALGIVLAMLGAPVAEKLLDTEISIATLLRPSFVAAIIFIVLAVGLVSGIIPAFVISRAKPIDVVRGTFTRHSRMVLSRIFMTLQNVITITMIGVSLTMVLQVDHLVSAPLGYDKENLMKIDFWGSNHSKVDAFRNELNSLPCVVKTSFCKGTPIDRGNNNTIIFPDGKEISFQVLIGDSCYFDILGLKIARDNHVADVNGAYVNNQTLKEAELKEDAKSMKYSLDGDPISIRGIMAPFQLGDITSFESPVLIFIHKKISDPWSILIKIKGDPIEAYNSVKEVYKTTFGMELTQERPYIDQIVQDCFDQQMRLSKIVSLFAGIAIIISLLGLVAMSQYFIQQRQREIAVRKVFGSTSRQVCFRLLRSFMIYVAIAFVIAIPIIWYFMSDWLSDYSYRISLSPWIFVAAGAFCFVVSLLAVVIQSNVAANENPIRHIKDNG